MTSGTSQYQSTSCRGVSIALLMPMRAGRALDAGQTGATPARSGPRVRGAADRRTAPLEIGLRRVATHHAMGVEIAGELGHRLFHHADPAGAVALVQRQHHLLQAV